MEWSRKQGERKGNEKKKGQGPRRIEHAWMEKRKKKAMMMKQTGPGRVRKVGARPSERELYHHPLVAV